MELKEIIEKIENFGVSTASYWGCALAGEVGELCNLIKKLERDGAYDEQKFKYEIADIFIYTALVAQFFEIDLEQAIIEKIKIVKERRK